jgi:hypothetical protein
MHGRRNQVPGIARRGILGRLYLLSDALLNATTESAEFRLHNLLRRLGHQYGRLASDEVCLDILLTQQDSAGVQMPRLSP